jgi:hypothetical protein
MLRLSSRGEYKDTIRYLKSIESNIDVTSILDKYGQIGVDRLSKATPVQSGTTASSWGYSVEKRKNGYVINFYNTNQNEGYHIVLLLMHGHVTQEGRWVAANDFVTPVIKELCEELQAEF